MRSYASIARHLIVLALATIFVTNIIAFSNDAVSRLFGETRVASAASWPPSPLSSSEAAKQTRAQAREAYGKLPLTFEVNRGQTDSQVRFLARGGDYTLFLTATEAVFALRKGTPREKSVHRDESSRSGNSLFPSHSALSTSTLRVKLVGADPEARTTGEAQLPGTTNYFTGRDPGNWRTNVPSYAKVRYQRIYPGVDMIYYGNQRELEYDFTLAAGADPKIIKMSFAGARAICIDRNGELILKTAGGDLRQHRPVAYQEIDGARKVVTARYALKGGEVGFEVGQYDRSKPLVIDPVLAYSTYLGGGGNDYGQDIAVDADGNAYVTGTTQSINFPTTAGAAQTTFGGGNNDLFVTKLNSTGSALVYSTYIGGESDDYVISLALDSSGSVYLTGETRSTTFPVTPGAYQTTLAGQNDVFVTKLDAAGAVLYSTFIGSNVDESASGIAVNSTGEAYITGGTYGTHYPTTPGAFQLTYPGNQSDWYSSKIFVKKLNASGSALVYSTYLTGSGTDHGRDIVVDAAGNAYVTGETFSADFPVTPGAFQTTLIGGVSCFVTKLNAAGSALVYSTYLSGSSGASGRLFSAPYCRHHCQLP